MNVFKLVEFFEKTSVEKLTENKKISSSILLRRIVKPKLLYMSGEYTPVWFYIGVKDHVIIPKTYCSCMDFIVNVMSRKTRLFCKHLLIQYISEKTNNYREVEINSVEELTRIINEIIDINISPTLRRLLFRRGD
ncbi:MAG: hypothetical protein QXX35_01605 [Desulfurococcaceae archaeon]